MALHIHTIFFMISSMLPSSFLYICAARDTITRGSLFRDINNDTLISAGERFQLGFFSPRNLSTNGRYIGIWYNNMDPHTVVWTANRDKPLFDTNGVFVIGVDGNLMVLDGNNNFKFTTGLENSRRSVNRTVKLLDSGNLVLSNDQSGDNLWQSFDHPTDTFLPGMKMDRDMKLTSWTSDDYPRSGNFTFRQDPVGENHFIIVSNGTTPYWRSEDTGSYTEMFPGAASFLSNGSNIGSLVPAQRLVMNGSGKLQFFSWYNNGTGRWSLIWSEPHDACSVYNPCGYFGICNNKSAPLCNCLPDFEPHWPDNWKSGDFSSGCKRKSSDQCGNNSTFVHFSLMKVGIPILPYQEVEGAKECEDRCLANCMCKAYACHEVYNSTQILRTRPQKSRLGCWIWTTDLYSLSENYTEGGHDLSVRVFNNDTEVGEPKREKGSQNKRTSTLNKNVFIFTIVIAVVVIISGISYISYTRMAMKRQGSRASNQGNVELRLYGSERRVKELIDSGHFEEDDKNLIDVPFFDLESILAATDNFSNKLGEGGFGPVYKGKFPGGQEIAVKRLSNHSGQGLEEFKNEVVLIAKLQHRNLVRLLGFCIKGDEKILLYEYMPNKSLDAILFDRTTRLLLDWEKRFDIILGVVRGLLYLHEDSRLRIIHRDMKTSNILLDEEMNPKISDFGLARIVCGKQTEVNTNKVIGTYGYMSPEYALDGQFSIKSDVYSFGVVVLEIVSGKRNTGFYRSPQTLNLLGYAWRLWKENKALDLMDQALLESCNTSEVLKCIIIGLLCVQEDPADRPTMSTVVFMLGSEIATLPNPKQPAFVARESPSTAESYSSRSKRETHSNIELTVTVEDGR